MRSATRTKKYQDEPYRQWILLQPCIVSGLLGAGTGYATPFGFRRSRNILLPYSWFVTGHHVRFCGGPRVDRRMVPLVDFLHMRGHEVSGQPCVERGKKIFEEFWHVDLEAEILRLNKKYDEAQRSS